MKKQKQKNNNKKMHCQFSNQKASRRFGSVFTVGKFIPHILLLLLLLFCEPGYVNEFYLFTEKSSFKTYTMKSCL